jgi:hypothetical protein
MPKYQIEFKHRGAGVKSFEYFKERLVDAFETTACEIANNCLKNRKSGARYWGPSEKPPKTLWVREYDEVKKAPKRGGQRRKLTLTFLQLTTDSGRKERQEWYEYTD